VTHVTHSHLSTHLTHDPLTHADPLALVPVNIVSQFQSSTFGHNY